MDTERIVTELQKLNSRVSNHDAIFATLDSRMGRVEVKLEEHDGRFDAIDKRFDAIDQKFDAIDQKFDVIDQKFDVMDERFDRIDAKLTDHDARMDTFATKKDMLDEGERTRNYMRVLYEDLRGQMRLIAEGHGALDEAQRHTEARVESLEERTARLELAARPKRQ